MRNRQRTRAIDVPRLKEITRTLLLESLELRAFELGIHFIGAGEMETLNAQYLQHEGSTDIVTFDHAEPPQPDSVHGELFISIDDAVAQARAFKTSWQSELVRYVVHGVLHLRGFDDLQPAARRKMKREENRLLRELSRHFSLSKLART